MGENKDSTDKNIESESSKMDKCEIKTNKKIEIKISRSTIEEIDNSQKTANKNDNSSYSSNISGNVVDDDSRSLNLEESENRKSDEIMKSDGNFSPISLNILADNSSIFFLGSDRFVSISRSKYFNSVIV
jgi:hypothetical protein